MELAEKNAALVLNTDRERLKREEGRTIGAVKELEKILGLTGIRRMEAYDISNTSGFASVGSMVVYERGKPKPERLSEVPDQKRPGAGRLRQHGRGADPQISAWPGRTEGGEGPGGFREFPDLILMDGGKGQVNVALEVLEKLGLSIPVCGMVKDDNHRTRGLYYNNTELPIDRDSECFRLITRIQDEAHRFAITFHRQLRGKSQVHSVLDDIPGVGPARRKDLMRHFENIDAIRNADIEELKKLPSMNEKSARDVYHFFH